MRRALPDAGLAMRKTASAAALAPGQSFTYTLAFSNTAGVTATNLTVTDTLPVSLTLTGVLSSGVALSQTGAAPALAWVVPSLAAGQTGVITLTGVVYAPAVITNSAGISSTYQFDPLANNFSQAAVTVADVHISGLTAANSGPTSLGQPTSLTATVTAGTNVGYAWDFGDSTALGSGALVTHTCSVGGTYTATVTATNSSGYGAVNTVVFIRYRLELPLVMR